MLTPTLLLTVREARRLLKANAISLPIDSEETMDDAFINESAEDRQSRLARQDKLAGRLGRLERRQLEEEETRVNLITLKADEQAALAGDAVARRRYMTIADKMITGMRQAPVMFPVDRVSNTFFRSFLVDPYVYGVQTEHQMGCPPKGIEREKTRLAKSGPGCQSDGYASGTRGRSVRSAKKFSLQNFPDDRSFSWRG